MIHDSRNDATVRLIALAVVVAALPAVAQLPDAGQTKALAEGGTNYALAWGLGILAVVVLGLGKVIYDLHKAHLADMKAAAAAADAAKDKAHAEHVGALMNVVTLSSEMVDTVKELHRTILRQESRE